MSYVFPKFGVEEQNAFETFVLSATFLKMLLLF